MVVDIIAIAMLASVMFILFYLGVRFVTRFAPPADKVASGEPWRYYLTGYVIWTAYIVVSQTLLRTIEGRNEICTVALFCENYSAPVDAFNLCHIVFAVGFLGPFYCLLITTSFSTGIGGVNATLVLISLIGFIVVAAHVSVYGVVTYFVIRWLPGGQTQSARIEPTIFD